MKMNMNHDLRMFAVFPASRGHTPRAENRQRTFCETSSIIMQMMMMMQTAACQGGNVLNYIKWNSPAPTQRAKLERGLDITKSVLIREEACPKRDPAGRLQTTK